MNRPSPGLSRGADADPLASLKSARHLRSLPSAAPPQPKDDGGGAAKESRAESKPAPTVVEAGAAVQGNAGKKMWSLVGRGGPPARVQAE